MTSIKEGAGTPALVLHPDLKANQPPSQKNGNFTTAPQSRTPEAALEEACGLARAIDLSIKASLCVSLNQRQPSTLFGSGKVEELGALIASHEIEVVIVNAPLTPVQQRNLERAWSAKVLDRTALILEIFGERARTREGQIQVDLAHLTYQRSRLVRSWTHLERQRGGVGFLGGPGETQIEADRRVIAEKITKLKRQLETVKRTRALHRKSRAQVPYPIVALVGYTNAGKSTLFNQLTQADVLAKDILFATLDPTMRAVRLASGQTIILSDTVGFVSDLPTQLIAAFRATLEEVREADIILHVCDISDPDTEHQKTDVLAILRELMEEGEEDSAQNAQAYVEIHNKIDLLSEEEKLSQSINLEDFSYSLGDELSSKGSRPPSIPISALKNKGLEDLLDYLDKAMKHSHRRVAITISAEEGGEQLAWCYRHSEVIERKTHDNGDIDLLIDISPNNYGRYEKLFGTA